MKKFLTVLFLSGIFCTFADDGGAKYPDEWTYGNIYVKESNPYISLENEFLYVNQISKEVRAVFDFRNNTKTAVSVPCAFPVVIKIPYEYDGSKIFSNDFRVYYDPFAFALAFNKTENLQDTNPVEYNKTLRVLTIQEYESFINQISKNNSDRYFKEVYSPVKLVLNGNKIPVTHVGIETEVVQSDTLKTPEYGGTPSYNGELTLKLHFYHELNFVSGSSILEAEYFIDNRKGQKRGEYFEGFYDIYTGGTWNGSIKNFIMICNSDVKAVNSNTTFDYKKLFNFGNYSYDSGTIISAKNYKPAKDEYFKFCSSIYDDEMYDEKIQNRKPLDFVQNVKASSYLPGTFTVDEKTFNYAPESSFDGDVLNGWVEGVKGDGIGEWIEFTLTKPAFGPFMTNGLTRDYYQKEDDEKSFYDEEEIKKPFYWQENNRIKRMTLQNCSTKEKIILNLTDVYAGFPTFGENEKIWISKNSNSNLCFLYPGTYRLYINDVYKGTKWDDTVLGEVWFYDFGTSANNIILEEKTLKKNFFTSEITKLFLRFCDKAIGNEKNSLYFLK